MTIQEMLNTAADLIKDTDTSEDGLWGLFATDRKLTAKPLRERTSNDTFVCHYDPYEVTYGLTGDDWTRLEARLRLLRNMCVI